MAISEELELTVEQYTPYPVGAKKTSTIPKMDGEAAIGDELTYAAGDHVHPSDTTKVPNTAIGAADGICPLDSSARIKEKYLPTSIETELDTIESKMNSLDTRVSDRMDTMDARMDSFTALEEGSTTGDAELIDGRVGADGKTYTNIGEAIRTQVSDLKTDIDDFIYPNFGEILKKRVVVAKRGSLNTNSGNETNSTTNLRTGFIPIKPNTEYHLRVENNENIQLDVMALFYDSSKSYISAQGISGSSYGGPALANTTVTLTFTSTASAAYLRIRLISYPSGTTLAVGNVQMWLWTGTDEKLAYLSDIDNTVANKGNITTAGLDLDTGDFIHAGMWSLSDLSYAPTNYPSTTYGRIVVFASTSASSYSAIQMVVDNFDTIYVRYSYSNGSWTTWKMLASKDEVDSAVVNRGNVSTAGLDLNTGDFIHAGMWFVNVLAYLPKHCPTNKKCRIICYSSPTNNSTGTYQMVIDDSNDIFVRYSHANGEFCNWRKLTTYHSNAFECLFTEPTPFRNDYDINRLGSDVENRVSKLYELYDAVTESGVTITKDTLGVDATEAFSIYNYKVSLNTGEKPIVLVICGEHGDELTSAYLGYYFYKECVQGVLKKYLRYVDFWIVPLMNPYGYEYRTRNNGNDVNLNRDFPALWQYSSSTHNKTGDYSMSQPETQIIYDLLVDNKDKILFMCNKHDTGSIAKKIDTEQEDIVAYVSTLMQCDHVVNNGVSAWENQQVRETDPWIIDDCVEDISDMTLVASRTVDTGGSLDVFANSIGIHGSLLEIAGAAYYTGDAQLYPAGNFRYKELARLGLDFFVNYIGTTIEKNAEILENDNLVTNIQYFTREEVGGEWQVVEQYWNGEQLINV